MKVKRIVRRAFLGVLLVGAALWAGYRFVLPGWLEGRLIDELTAAGFDAVELTVEEVTLGQVVVTGIAIGRGAPLTVGRATVDFELAQLLDGQVRNIVVDDIVWRTRIDEGSVALAPFDSVGDIASAESTVGRTPAHASARPVLDLPFESLELASLRVVLTDGDSVHEIAMQAAARSGAVDTKLDVTANYIDRRLESSVELTENGGEVRGEFTVSLDHGEDRVALDGGLTSRPSAEGRTFELHAESAGDGFAATMAGLRIVATGADVRLHTARIGASVVVDAALAATGEGQVRIEALDADGPWGDLDGTELAGRMTVAGGTRVDAPTHARVDFEQLEIRQPELDLAIHNVNGTVAFDDVGALTTAPGQSLTWTDLSLGEFRTIDGQVTVKMPDSDTVEIEGLSWGISPHGAFELAPFAIDLSAPAVATTVRLVHVPLETWLDLVSSGRVRGDGRLVGEFAVNLRTRPRLSIEFGAGQLRAVGGGVIEVVESAEVLEVIDSQIGPAIAQSGVEFDGVVRERIVESVKDFEFSTLTFDFLPSAEDVTLRVRTAGRGRKVPQELDMTVNFNGFNDLVAVALAVSTGIDFETPNRRAP